MLAKAVLPVMFSILILGLIGIPAQTFASPDVSLCYQVGQNDAEANKLRNPEQPILKQEAFYAFEAIGQQGDWKTFEQEFSRLCVLQYTFGYDDELDNKNLENSNQFTGISSSEVHDKGLKEGTNNNACKQDGKNDALNDKSKTRVSPADVEFRALASFNQVYKGSILSDAAMYEVFLQGFTYSCQDIYAHGYDSAKNGDGNIFEDTFGQIKESVEEKVTGAINENAEHLADELGESIADQIVPDVSSDDCIIATASFGSPMAKEVQMLREIRDNQLLKTESGTAFMGGFNQFYYSFAPTVAGWEHENPVFKEVVKTVITPLITSMSLLNYVSMDSEVEVLTYGISMILLNLGMYFAAPAIIIWQVRKRI